MAMAGGNRVILNNALLPLVYGGVATPSRWMSCPILARKIGEPEKSFLRSFADLRAPEEPDASFKGVLRETTIEALAHLGPGAFGEISGEVVNIVLFSLTKAAPSSDHRLTAFRLIGPKSPEEKDRLLRQALNSINNGNDSRSVN